MRHRVHDFFCGLTKFVSRPWYVPLVALFAALDSFLVVIPVDALLVARIVFRRKHWIWTVCWIALGSAVGAWLLALLVQHNAHWILGTLFKNAQHDEKWRQASSIVQRHGPIGVFLVSLSPIPQHPAVIVGALAKMSSLAIFLAVLAARLIKYGVWGGVSAHAPGALLKFKPIRRAVGDFIPSQSR